MITNKVLGSLPPPGDNWIKFPAPKLGLTQLWLLKTFGESTNKQKSRSLALSPSVFPSLSPSFYPGLYFLSVLLFIITGRDNTLVLDILNNVAPTLGYSGICLKLIKSN